jgi:hypothetical protein
MFKRSLFAVVMAGVMLLGGWTQNAKAYVYENSHMATCAAFGLWGTTNAPYVRVRVYNAQTGADLFDQTMATPGDGTLLVDVDFTPQPEGSILYYFVHGLNSSNPNDYDGEYWYELNDGYPCSGQGSEPIPQPLNVALTSRSNKCSSFAAAGISNAPYIGVEVRTPSGTLLYRNKLATSMATFAFNATFAPQPRGKVLEYLVWPSTTSTVTPLETGNAYYYEKVGCKR